MALVLLTGTTLHAYDVQIDNDTTDLTIKEVIVSACVSPGTNCQNTGAVTIGPGCSTTLHTDGTRCPSYIMYHITNGRMTSETAHGQCITPTTNMGLSYPSNCGTSCAASHWRLKYVNGAPQMQPK